MVTALGLSLYQILTAMTVWRADPYVGAQRNAIFH